MVIVIFTQMLNQNCRMSIR